MEAEVAPGDLMVFQIIGVHAIGRNDYVKVALVGIDSRCTDAGMSIDARNDKCERLDNGEEPVQVGAEESAIALLNDDGIRRKAVEFWQDLAAVGAGNGSPDAVLAHGGKGIGKIGRELLPDPVDRLSLCSEGGGELID